MESEDSECASLAEIEEKVRALSDQDLIRLERFARWQVYRYPIIDPKEVLGEAVARALEGTRTWPRKLNFTVYLCGAMRSIAHEMREEAAQSKATPTDEQMHSALDLGGNQAASAEKVASDRQLLEEVWKIFNPYPDVQALIKGLATGLSANETQKAYSLTQPQYDAARKRLERTLARRYPEGAEK